MSFTLELGTKVKSNLSGFQGIVTSRAEHINGCNRYWVAPPVDKDGKLVDGSWFDEAELDVVEPPAIDRRNQDRGGFPSKVK